ncbi:MAG: diguanylate cyclase [Armatimonadetes bacterium]|nr:diguanylate cyclase [Armatimonadota bacterium]
MEAGALRTQALTVLEGLPSLAERRTDARSAYSQEREPLMRTVAHLIKPNRVWLHPDHTVETALILLRGHQLTGLPVYDGQQVVGTVEYAQLLGVSPETPVSAVMYREIPHYTPETPLRTVAEWFLNTRRTFLPIVQEGKPVGSLTVFDLLPEIGRSYDPMTGLPWSDTLREWGIEQLSQGREITVIFFDLDNFGAFNKRYGHLVGDEVLRRVARILVEETNPETDIVCRWGGDEFAIATLRRREEAGLLAHHLSRQIASIQIPDVDMPIMVSYGYQGGKRTREREQVHYAATVDNLVNLASQECMLMKGITPARGGAQLTLPMQAAVESRPPERRIRIQTVSYEREGRRAKARVYLQIENRVLEGVAEGEARLHPLIAEAVLNALRPILPPNLTLSLINASETQGETGHAVVNVILLWENGEVRQELVGSALMRDDAARAVAAAVLDALNRPLTRILESL